jgi:hypothetical protein
MSALEQEILDKLQLLDRPAKQRVLNFLFSELGADFDVHTWLADLREIRTAIADRTGSTQGVSVMDLLHETREEL